METNVRRPYRRILQVIQLSLTLAIGRHTMTLRYPKVRLTQQSACTQKEWLWLHHCAVAAHSPQSDSIFIYQTPTADEREALNAYFHLTSRLYPCGECAAEFQLLLAKYPPQVRYHIFSPPVLPSLRSSHSSFLVLSRLSLPGLCSEM